MKPNPLVLRKIRLRKNQFLIPDQIMNTIAPQLIEKEAISALHFPTTPIANRPIEIKALKRKLDKAMILGNAHHNKIRILFEDDQGLKEVRTTIWASGENYIVLKQGVTIPIHRIRDVRL